MANNIEQELLSVLRDIKTAINSGKYSRDNKHATPNNSTFKSAELADKASKLSDAFEEQSITLGKFSKNILSEIIPSLKIMNQGFGGAKKSLQEYTKYSDQAFKNISNASFDIFSKITGNSKKFQKEFDDIISTQIAAKKSVENALKNIKDKKNRKNNINDAKIAIESLEKSKFGAAFVKSIDKNTLEALKNGKINKIQLNELNSTLSQAMSGTMAGGKFALMGANSIKGLVGKSLLTFFTEILPKIANQGLKDYRSNNYYGIGGTTYGSNLRHLIGISEDERAQMIGRNKRSFSLLGQGDLNSSFENGTFSKLQDNLAKYGLFGKDADAEIEKDMQSLSKSGFATIGDNLQKFDNLLHAASETAQVAPEELRDFAKTMSDSGEMALTAASLRRNGEKDQLKAILQNSSILFRVNQNLGLNTDEIKQQNQNAFNAGHADVIDTVKNAIGVSLLPSILKQIPKDILEQTESLNNLPKGTLTNLSNTDKMNYASFATSPEDYQNKLLATTFKGQDQATVMAISKSLLSLGRASGEIFRQKGEDASLTSNPNDANAGLVQGALAQILPQVYRTFNPNLYAANGLESAKAQANLITASANKDAGNIKPYDPAKESLDAMVKAISDRESGVVTAIGNFKAALDTISGNPIGSAAGSGNPIGSAAGSIAETLWLTSKLIKPLGSIVTRGLGATLAETLAPEALSASLASELGITATSTTTTAATGIGAAGAGTIGGIAALLGSGFYFGKKHLDNLAKENNLSDGEKNALALAGPENMDLAMDYRDMYREKHPDFSDVKSTMQISSNGTNGYINDGKNLSSQSAMQDLFNTIIKGEGGNKSYDSLYAGSDLAMQMFGKPLSQLTIGQVKQVQAAYAQQQTINGIPKKKQSDAAGAFQIMGFNMNKYANAAGLNDNDLFNQINQQKMAVQGWNRPGTSWQDFLSGKITPEQMLNNVFSNEYASIANTNGTNGYINDGINHPSLFAPTMLPILKQIQNQALNDVNNSNSDQIDLLTDLKDVMTKVYNVLVDHKEQDKTIAIQSQQQINAQLEAKANMEAFIKRSQTAAQTANQKIASFIGTS